MPIGICGLLVTLVHVRESRDPSARRIDLGLVTGMRPVVIAGGALVLVAPS